MGDFVSNAGLMNGGDGITATDDGGSSGAGGGGDGFGYFEGALRKSGHFEYAHGAVPDDGFGGSNFLAIGVDSFRSDVQAHPAVWRRRNGNRFRGGVGLKLGTDKVIDGKEQSKFLLLGFGTEPLGKIEFFVFYKRFADGLAFSFVKS